jgi:hypothetical protein
MELIICGDFNINFLNNTTHKQLLNSLLATYGLYSTVRYGTVWYGTVQYGTVQYNFLPGFIIILYQLLTIFL